METIAILEDDADLRALIAELFELALGVHAVTAGSVAQLIDKAPEVLHSQLAILDVNLGQELPTGFDAYDWLRENHYSGRVVFLTGHAHSDTLMQRARAVPGVRVLQKPVSADQLLDLARLGGADEHAIP